jgi:GTP cyclohydrolase IA
MTARDEKIAKLTKAMEDFLRAADLSPGRHPELVETPLNTANMWLDEMLDGYNGNPAEILSGGSPVSGESSMVIVRDLFFHSTCPHHLLPYHGKAHVAYVPDGRIIGLSKIARLVDCFAHRLILQETLGQLVADALVEHLHAKGAACMVDAEQLCMVLRGVRRPGSRALSVSYAGSFTLDKAVKMEFLTAINAKG